MTDLTTCTSCGHAVDPTAKLCLYCGANPNTGERVVDAQAMLQEVFKPKSLTRSESVMEYARQRQTAVVAISIVVGFLVLAALHQVVTMRNDRAVADSPAVPLTEITDVSARGNEAVLAMPDLHFQYDGRPRVMQTFIVEPGAVAPAPPPPPSGAPGAALPPAPSAANPVPVRPPATTPQRR